MNRNKRERQHRRGSYNKRGSFKVVPFGEVWRVTGYRLDGGRVRENFKTQAEALATKQNLEIEQGNVQAAGRAVITTLTPEQVNEAEGCFARLPSGQSLSKILDYFMDNWREPVTNISIKDGFDKFIAEKTAANLRPLSIKNLKAKASELLTTYGQRTVAGVAAETVRGLIFKDGRGPKARDNYRRALNSFFGWAVRNGYCAENPVSKITPIKAERQEPVVLTPEQAGELLEAAQGHKRGVLAPYVAIGLFAGLRPTELARLTWDRIDLSDRTITVGADVAKMRSKRIVEMSENLAAWLSPFAAKKPAIVGKNWRRDFDAVKKAAGWGGANRETEDEKAELKPWAQDTMRHTAVSYHLAEHQHEGKTATWAGNSPDVIQKHYKGLVKLADAKKFWNILPPASKKVVKLKQEPKRTPTRSVRTATAATA